MQRMKFMQNMTRTAMLLLAVFTSLGTRADELSTPLTFEAATDAGATVSFMLDATAIVPNSVEYCVNDGNWYTYTSKKPITLNEGEKVQFRGKNATYAVDGSSSFTCDADCYVYGNVMSLIDKDNFATLTELTGSYTFYHLFYNNPYIRNHSSKELLLPATSLTKGCYYMMFEGCSGLTKAPSLPAPTLTDWCYAEMFWDCIHLNRIVCLATDISAPYCTSGWVRNVSATGTFTMAEGMTVWTTGNDGIPSGSAWTKNATTAERLVPLTLEATKDRTTVTFKLDATAVTTPVECRINDGEWTEYTSEAPIKLNQGDMVHFRGENVSYAFDAESIISCDKDSYVYGNVMSLISKEDFATLSVLTEQYALWGLFKGNEHIVNHESKELLLPATVLSPFCYGAMFSGCKKLTKAPSLPSTKLTEGCYSRLFENCTSLKTAPALPATILESQCYYKMFRGCTKLTESPLLPATELKHECYFEMFYGCTKLNTVTCYAKNIDNEETRCTFCWMTGVADEGTFNQADGMEDWTSGPNGIPSGWATKVAPITMPLTLETRSDNTIVRITLSEFVANNVQYRVYNSVTGLWGGWSDYTHAITLPKIGDKVQFRKEDEYGTNQSNISCSADCWVYGNIISLVKAEGFAKETELKQPNSFNGLFQNNVHIDIHPEMDFMLPATTLSESCYECLFEGCEGLTKAPVLPATTLTNRCYASMFDGCKGLTKAPSLPATTLAKECYESIFRNCISLTESPALPATNLTNYCYYEMFEGCTSLVAAPALPAMELAEGCYYKMFSGCSCLTEAPDLPAKVLADMCYYGLFNKCKNLNRIFCTTKDISADKCTYSWLDSVALTGVFYKAKGIDDWTKDSPNGIPTGWTVVECEYYEINNLAAGSYSTHFYDEDVTLTETDDDIRFYSVISVGTDEVSLTEITGKAVPAGTPFLIYNANEYAAKSFTLMGVNHKGLDDGLKLFTVPKSVDYDEHFAGTATEKTFTDEDIVPKDYYLLDGHIFLFVRLPGTIQGHRCWLELEPKVSAARSLGIVFGDATDVNKMVIVNSDKTAITTMYDLQGLKVKVPLKKGIYVRDGQKVIIK